MSHVRGAGALLLVWSAALVGCGLLAPESEQGVGAGSEAGRWSRRPGPSSRPTESGPARPAPPSPASGGVSRDRDRSAGGVVRFHRITRQGRCPHAGWQPAVPFVVVI